MRTIKGNWVHVNRVELEDGSIQQVYPYGMTLREVDSMLPMNVFILLDDTNVVINYLKIE